MALTSSDRLLSSDTLVSEPKNGTAGRERQAALPAGDIRYPGGSGGRRSAVIRSARGRMRTRTGWRALLLTTAGIILAPTSGRGQEVPFADPQWPVPLGHDRLEKGGLYFHTDFLLMRETN